MIRIEVYRDGAYRSKRPPASSITVRGSASPVSAPEGSWSFRQRVLRNVFPRFSSGGAADGILKRSGLGSQSVPPTIQFWTRGPAY